ncbi:MAG: Glycine dehydrogenase [decarboxylating] (glycine cleavage system P2 protein) [Candidatus Ozemobacter sibiricus]|uniref:Probable glycine dehydrogenase (decarboxylating) subunit 2 n=1 Tax=Candidatus Ozemobacter sibiricus TaxID=2268124 RepID=A0A367ZKD8_9BACT|nr:MAG: Glycine dehydrogenase [decarboxylating] (glycine cleavage system P2 protein) [Candidatus Ozemobacter sibiricus]
MNGPEPLIFEMSQPGTTGFTLPEPGIDEIDPADHIPGKFLRSHLPLPSVAEVDVVRHFTRLSRKNHAIDVGFYPLGSCTMKYNPKVNEDMARLPGFAALHPYQPESTVQGALALMKDLEYALCEITGMDAFTLQPAAGAHGELTGLLLIKAYHDRKKNKKTKILIPDAGHGTNPASAAQCGYEVVTIKSDAQGGVDLEDLKAHLGPEVAGLMLTNPNTLGLFEPNVEKIAELIHGVDGLLYYDGANLNAIMGWTRPGDMGFDVMHVNVHKTFSTPHGGGGPGAGPVGVKKHLEPFLPCPRIAYDGKKYKLITKAKGSIGTMRTFVGSFGVLVRAYTYITQLGAEGLKEASSHAVLNANYLMARLKKHFLLPYDRFCKHEFVLSGKPQAAKGVKTLDIAKRLLDYGFHAPTVYFPLIVEEAIMIEPTETESKKTLDAFVEALEKILQEIETNPELVKTAPHTTPVGRLDEALAARKPDINFFQRPAG